MHVLELDGHRYSTDHGAPRMYVLSSYAAAQKAKAAGHDPGMSQIVTMEFLGVLEDQLDGIHRVVFGACSCALVTDDVRVLGGHLDLRDLEVARTFVIADRAGFAMACQSCREITEAGSRTEAADQATHHQCEWRT